MRRATHWIATGFGMFAGIGGLEHGYFEMQQGHVRPDGLMISSMGPPCVPEEVWHACEPAMTIVPTYFYAGLLSVFLGAIALVWAAAFVQRRRGGLILMGLSLLLLLVGGGIFPPLIGLIGGAVGTRINASLTWWRTHLTGPLRRGLAALWPWVALVFFAGLFGQVLLGFVANDWLMTNAVLIPVFILLVMAVSVLAAFAHDTRQLDEAVV